MLIVTNSALLAKVLCPMRNAQSLFHKSPVFINGRLLKSKNFESSPKKIVRGIADESSGMDQNVQKLSWSARQEFWQKNKNLNRPISPHMTIYSWQYTNTWSITHRATGIAWYGGVLVLAVPYMMLPYMFPAYIEYLASMNLGSVILGAGKFLISWPIVYHTLNGTRHLAWDAGYGLNLEALKKSAYGTVALSVLISLGLACISLK